MGKPESDEDATAGIVVLGVPIGTTAFIRAHANKKAGQVSERAATFSGARAKVGTPDGTWRMVGGQHYAFDVTAGMWKTGQVNDVVNRKRHGHGTAADRAVAKEDRNRTQTDLRDLLRRAQISDDKRHGQCHIRRDGHSLA